MDDDFFDEDLEPKSKKHTALIIIIIAAVIAVSALVFVFILRNPVKISNVFKSAASEEETTAPAPMLTETLYTRADIPISDDYPVTTQSKDYIIRINLAYQCMTAYQVDVNGNETPVKAFACSTARSAHLTPEDTYYTDEPYCGSGWCYMIDGTYGKYAYSLITADDEKYDGFMFHTVPCTEEDSSTMEWAEFNKLGTPASMGCVRLATADVIWLLENVGTHSLVVIYSDETTPGPLGKPETMFVPGNLGELSGWDPTDPASYNPWHEFSFTMDIDNEINLTVSDKPLDLSEYISAFDNYENDLSGYATYTCNDVQYGFYFEPIDPEVYTDDPYERIDQELLNEFGYKGMDISQPGTYVLRVSLSIGPLKAEKDVVLNVSDPAVSTETSENTDEYTPE